MGVNKAIARAQKSHALDKQGSTYNSKRKKKTEEYELLTHGSDMVFKVKIMGKQMEVLIDSGSKVSLLKTTAFGELNSDATKLQG